MRLGSCAAGFGSDGAPTTSAPRCPCTRSCPGDGRRGCAAGASPASTPRTGGTPARPSARCAADPAADRAGSTDDFIANACVRSCTTLDALAVVFPDHDQRAAQDAGRREVRQRIGGDVGADDRLPGHRTADRVIDRRGQHRAGRQPRWCRLRRARRACRDSPAPGPSRRAAGIPASPGSRRRTRRRIAAAPWSRPGCLRRGIPRPRLWRVVPLPVRTNAPSLADSSCRRLVAQARRQIVVRVA